MKDWFLFFGELFVKYRDGYVTSAAPEVPVCGCETTSLEYPSEWYDRIAEDTGDRYIVPESAKGSIDEIEMVQQKRRGGERRRGTAYHSRPSIRKRDLRAMN